MIALPVIFSLIFFSSFVGYAFFGFYILNYDDETMRKRVLFSLCIAMCIWSFGFSIANSAPDYETALFWRRFSAMGWGSAYSFLLHFILILTGKSQVLEKKYRLFLIYCPVFINLLIFSFYSPIANNQYLLYYTAFGWVNHSLNNAWDFYFNLYYLVYTLLSIGLIINWGYGDNPKRGKASRLLFLSFAIALALGTATDILLNTYNTGTAPQMAPFIILIPIGAILYSIQHYDLMKPKTMTTPAIEGEILSQANYQKIYDYLTLFFLVGGSFDFALSFFILQSDFVTSLLFALGLYLLGMVIYSLKHAKIQKDHRDLFTVLILAGTLLALNFKYINFAFTTIWAAPAIAIILLIPFHKNKYLKLFGILSLLIMLLVAITTPSLTIQITTLDHFIQFIVFLSFLTMAMFINRIFLIRLAQNEKQVRIQKLVSQISSDLINTNQLNYQEKVRNLLELCGRQYQVERANLCLFSADMKCIDHAFEWCDEGVEPTIGKLGSVETRAIPWFVAQICNSSGICIPNVETLPPEAVIEKEIFKNYQIESLLSVPVSSNDQILGFLRFDSVSQSQVWREETLEILSIISNILADALVKINAEKEINNLAFYDGLTGLPNRMLFKDRLVKAIDSAQRDESYIGVIFLDLDGFKAINDSLGHDAGDELLKIIAARLAACVRKQDTVCRFGGDEYLIMLPHITDSNDIHPLSSAIMDTFREPMTIKAQEFFVTASAGVALYPIDGNEADLLIKNADLAMYTSKEQGKNKYTLCSPLLREDVMTKMKLTNAFYRALERDQLELYYLPQLTAETEAIVGIEALIRWHHPEMGIITPEVFMPMVEQHASLIGPIGKWVLTTACRQCQSWHAAGLFPIRIAVKLSAAQFNDPDLVTCVRKALEESGIDPHTLELEITERVALKSKVNAVSIMNELRSLGVTIAIDHFGIEYSSLNRLKLLPIDRIKMDTSFVRGLGSDSKDEAIARIIIQLAKNLELKVTAEGVETKSQFLFLKNESCDEVQGYYFYRPMPPEIAELVLFPHTNMK
jgi:diguanylate cyclase (GGDEF)-like protein